MTAPMTATPAAPTATQSAASAAVVMPPSAKTGFGLPAASAASARSPSAGP
jgi:hypothetical protein